MMRYNQLIKDQEIVLALEDECVFGVQNVDRFTIPAHVLIECARVRRRVRF
jgi:hypothetical protein